MLELQGPAAKVLLPVSGPGCLLAALKAAIIMSQPTHKAARPRRKKSPLIYLVDDQPMLLDLAEISLQADGYDFRKFEDPELALDSFLRSRAKPDLLITD